MRNVRRAVCALLACLMLLAVCPVHVFAAGPIEPEKKATLNILYQDEGKPIPNARFSIYRVASVNDNAKLTVTSAFEKYVDTVSGLQYLNNLKNSDWLALASTLRGYVLMDKMPADDAALTDQDGECSFPDLKTGLYLVIAGQATTDDYYTYTEVPFMALLPTEDREENVWDYDVTVLPKFTKSYLPPEEDDDYVTRKALKVWNDSGYEKLRPAEVTVHLLKNGDVYATEKLNADNNWRCAWDNLDAQYEWDVVEDKVEGYAVTITREGITFTVTNKYIIPITGTNLPIQKKITGSVPSTDSTFTFVFTAENKDNPMPEGSVGLEKEVSIVGAGTAEIGEITFEKAGTYVYTVRELKGKVSGYKYDKTIYTVTFTVTEKDGDLSVKRSIEDQDGNEIFALEFDNPYTPPSENIPQTGVLWWPVPILLCMGMLLIMIGMIWRRRYEG